MGKDLTKSDIDRQNILNNPYAIDEIKKATNLQGVVFQGKWALLKDQVADFFEVTPRTIDTYLSNYELELKGNGYEVLRGKDLQEFKLAVKEQYVDETDFVDIKVPQIGIFDFKAFLNLSMLLTESERARILRQVILDIVIDTINQKTGGGTKYINQRDEDFIVSYFEEENYRKEFTNALDNYVSMGKIKYAIYTNKIYKSIFKEDAQEYRRILKLHKKDKVRDTLYAQVLDLISSYEFGFAKVLEDTFKKVNRKLTSPEADKLFLEFESQALWKPLVDNARNQMASKDLAFRDVLHIQLKEYITPLDSTDFERFLGERSKELVDRLEEAKDVLKRLKERE